MGSSCEQLYNLAENVKLNAHGRHPTVYPFISCCFCFTFIFIVFLFSSITLVYVFRDRSVLQFKFGGML
jgi:hypothetical protein